VTHPASPETDDQQPADQARPVDPHTGRTFGDVVPTRSRATSKVEAQVRDFLAASGYPVPTRRVGVLCHHTDARKTFLTLTPDVVFEDLRLAVEVDPCGDTNRYDTHAGDQAKDRLRNDLLAAVGWTVIRLRLDAKEGDHIGERDVVVESSGFTKAAQTALIEAIDDHRAQRPARVRFVPKGTSPTPAKRRSPVVNIGLDRYSDDTYWFTWYPNLDSPESHKYRLAANGRYLYARDGLGSVFVAELGLQEVDRADWKARLTDYLADKTPADLRGTTKWPWGDTLLLPATHADPAAPDEPADPVVADIIRASDHEKQTIDRINFWFTFSGDHVAGWTPDTLHRADETPIVSMHPDAVAVGYRFAAVSLDRGYRGPYQRITITRAPAQA